MFLPISIPNLYQSFQFFFKNYHNMGSGWLQLKEPSTIHELNGIEYQGVVRLGQMELITVMQI